MSQSINSPSSPKINLHATVDVGKVYPPSNTASKRLPEEGNIHSRSTKHVERCQNDGEGAQDRLDAPLETPQEWEPEISDFDFDFTASPGAEAWQISETTEGCAVYSTVDGTGVGMTVEFKRWDW
ncbi:hypothetical protein FRC00_009965 [Tulasnella sp. 408]|nr:hypothetical protein FRC00_009965 [Tulasnella sp. 408]